MKGIYLPEYQVRAALDGRLKQFTKPLKSQPIDILPMNIPDKWVALMSRGPNAGCVFTSQYKVGVQYYVKETWKIVEWDPENGDWEIEYRSECRAQFTCVEMEPDKENEYWEQCTDDCLKAGVPCDEESGYFLLDDKPVPTRWRSPITMPAWAARILVTPTEIVVRRVQDMTEQDAGKDGVQNLVGFTDPGYKHIKTKKEQFIDLWNKQYPKTPWESNPWVVTYMVSVEVKK